MITGIVDSMKSSGDAGEAILGAGIELAYWTAVVTDL